LLAAFAALLLSTGVVASGTDYAMIMPKASTSLLLDVAAAGERLVAVGERGHIVYSDDKGQSWVQARVPTSVMLNRVFFLSDEQGWVVGHDGHILMSRDGGINWEMQRDGLADQARINEERAGRAKSEVTALREQLDNAGEDQLENLELALEEAEYALENALEDLDTPVYAPPLMDIWFANEEQGWASGAFGALLHTTNGGRTWEDWSYQVENPEELHLNGVTGGPDNSVFLASEWGYVFRSVNGGQTWEAVESGYDGSYFGIVTNPTTGSVFAYGLLGTIYRSTDLGQSWEALNSMARASLFGAHASADGTLVFVGQGGSVVRTDDDGESFTPLPQTSRRGLYGVAPIAGGGFMLTGDGGNTVMEDQGNPQQQGQTVDNGGAR
jgi:photosystem II stability/assembly factor-like uncharacterized protein